MIRTQGGKLLVSGGALASGSGCCCGEPPPCSGPCDGENPCPEGCVCVDGQCVPSVAAGACCECPLVEIEGYGSLPFENENDAQDWVSWENGTKAPAMKALAEENGWECAESTDAYISSQPPDDEFYIAEGAFILGRCCGTVTETFVELDIENHPANPFVTHGVYVCDASEGENRTCVDNKTAEECAAACGTHHPGQTCADDPCCALPERTSVVLVSNSDDATPEEAEACLEAYAAAMLANGYATAVPTLPPTTTGFFEGEVFGTCCGTIDYDTFIDGPECSFGGNPASLVNFINPCMTDNPLP
mgnify:CR=1 FL=1